ncbi:cytochrome c oxidase subunit 2A [Deinococcus sp.]|nr:cytochrome c oxidase subunit 2A [Deinococcus sp.]
MTTENQKPDDVAPASSSIPRGALAIVAVVFTTIMALWFLVLGVFQARS